MKKLIDFSSFLIFFTIIWACQKDSKEAEQPDHKESIIISSITKQPEKLSNFNSAVVDSNQLVLSFNSSSNLPNYKSGDILIGNTGDGYIRKVIATSIQGNKVTILTSPAPLDEAFSKIKIDTSFYFSVENQSTKAIDYSCPVFVESKSYLYSVKSSQPVIKSLNSGNKIGLTFPNVSFEIGTLDNTGSLSISADTLSVILTIQLKKFSIDYLNFNWNDFTLIYGINTSMVFKNVSIKLSGNIKGQYPSEKKENLLPKNIPLGGIPGIPVLFSLNMGATIEGNFSMGLGGSFITTIKSNSECDLGAQYKNGQCTKIWNRNSTGSSKTEVNFSPNMSGETRINLKPKLFMKICGLTGPDAYVTAFGYGEFSAPPLDADVGFGLNAGLEYDYSLFSKSLISFNWVFTEFKWPFWQLSNNPPTNPTIISPLINSLDQSIHSNLNWNCTDPDNDPLRYDVYFGTSTVPVLVSSNQLSKSYSPGALKNNTKYFWKIVAKDNKGGVTEGGVWNFTTSQNIIKPVLTTTPVTNQTQTTATVGGNVTSDGGASVTEHGVYWGTSSTPETNGTKLQIGSGTGIFSTSLTGLNPNTTYYVKAYATNSQGTSFGEQISFTTLSSSTIPANGLVAYYPLDGNAIDGSGNGNNGTVNSLIPIVDKNGNANSAYSFDGNTAHFISVPNLSLGDNTKDKSFSAWFKLSSKNTTNWLSIIGQWVDGSHRWHLTVMPNSITFYEQNGSDNRPYGITASIDTTNWHFLAAVCSNSFAANQKIKIYLDGIYLSSIASYNLVTYSSNYNIGRYGDSKYWPVYGNVDDIRVYNRTLSEQEITTIFNDH